MSLPRMLREASRWIGARLDVRSERAASAVEYGIMVMLIAAVIVVAVFFLGNQTSRTFSCTAGSLQATTNACG